MPCRLNRPDSSDDDPLKQAATTAAMATFFDILFNIPSATRRERLFPFPRLFSLSSSAAQHATQFIRYTIGTPTLLVFPWFDFVVTKRALHRSIALYKKVWVNYGGVLGLAGHLPQPHEGETLGFTGTVPRHWGSVIKGCSQASGHREELSPSSASLHYDTGLHEGARHKKIGSDHMTEELGSRDPDIR